MKSLFLTAIIIFVFSSISSAKEIIKYHRVEITVSDPRIIEWNVKNPDTTGCYCEEHIDSAGRTIELLFRCKGKIFGDFEVGVIPRVRYEYQKNKIIEKRLWENGTPYDCIISGQATTVIYYINNRLEIDSCKSFVVVPKSAYKEYDSIKIKEMVKDAESFGEGGCSEIWEYYYATAKYRGHNPRSIKWDSTKMQPDPNKPIH
jgi:hypothetical protein